MMSDIQTRVAVLETKEGQPFILRANPTIKEIQGFVREQNRRVDVGAPAGPSGIPARHITSAKYFDNEVDMYEGKSGTDISGAVGIGA